MIEFFVFLVIVLGIITLLGHGLWVLGAFVIRSLNGVLSDTEKPAASERDCPVCAHHLPPFALKCELCGWRDDPAWCASAITRHQIERLVQLDLVAPETRTKLFAALQKSQAIPLRPSPSPHAPRTTQPQPQPQPQPPLATFEPAEPAVCPTPDESEIVEAILAPPALPLVPQRLEPSNTDITIRAKHYQQQREAARSAPEQQAPREPVPPPAPQRNWHELLAAFMEERNMRWGEVVGGLVIISCSIALVISFWSEIAERPILKFGVFNGVTAGLFALGLHAAHRWKLPTTSQGILITASMLVPLNFIAIVAFTTTPSAHRALTVFGEIFSTILFGALLYLASRVLTPRHTWQLTSGALIPSVTSLVIGRYISPSSSLWFQYATVGCCAVGYALAVGTWRPLWSHSDENDIDDATAHRALKLLGVTSFATALACALQIFRLEPSREVLSQFSPMIAFLSIPSLAMGLTLWRRGEQAWASLVGTVVTVVGGILLAGSMAFAWPAPGWLATTGFLSFAILTYVAITFNVREAHFIAALGAAVSLVCTGHLMLGTASWANFDASSTIQLFASATTAQLLVLFVSAYAAAAFYQHREQRETERNTLSAIAASGAIVSLILITLYGFGIQGDPEFATYVYALYATGLAVAAIARCDRRMMISASALLLPAILQAVVYGPASSLQLADPWSVAFLLHALVSALGTVVAESSSDIEYDNFVRPLTGWTLASLAATAVALFVHHSATATWIPASYFGVAAVILAVITWSNASRSLLAACQAVTSLTVARAVCEVLASKTWYQELRVPLAEPWTLQWLGIALAASCLAWIALRYFVRLLARSTEYPNGVLTESNASRPEPPVTEPNVDAGLLSWREKLGYLFDRDAVAFDRGLSVALVLLAVGLTVYAVAPGAAQELTSRHLVTNANVTTVLTTSDPPRLVPATSNFELASIPHQHATGRAMWCFLLALVILIIALLIERTALTSLALSAATAMCMLLLPAYLFESKVAVASAIRWLTATLFAVGSVLVYCRRPITDACHATGIRFHLAHTLRTGEVILLLVLASTLPLIAMGGYVSLAALHLTTFSSDISTLWTIVLLLAVISLLITVGLRYTSDGIQVDGETSRIPSRRPQFHLGLLTSVLGTAPSIVVTLYAVGYAIAKHPIVGPNPDSIFARMGLSASYAVPILIMAISLIGHALRERSEVIAICAGLVLNFCATAAYLLSPSMTGLDAATWLHLAELNAVVAGVFALGWMGLLAWSQNDSDDATLPSALLNSQIGLVGCLVGVSLIVPLVTLFLRPDTTLPLHTIAGYFGWPMLTVFCISLAGRSWLQRQPQDLFSLPLTVFGIGAAILVPFELYRVDSGSWLSYHAFSSILAVVAATLAAIGMRPILAQTSARARDELRVPLLLTVVLIAFAIRGLGADPQHPWWSITGLLLSTLLLASVVYGTAWRSLLYLASMCTTIAATTWWLEIGERWFFAAKPFQGPFNTFHAILVSISLLIPCWMWIEQRLQSRTGLGELSDGAVRKLQALPAHRFFSPAVVVLFGLSAGSHLLWNLSASTQVPSSWVFSALTSIVISAGVASCLWDARTRWTLALLYAQGLASVTLFIAHFDVPERQLIWSAAMCFAAYAVATSYLWSRRIGLRRFADHLQIPSHTTSASFHRGWLMTANLLVIVVVTSIGFVVILSYKEFPFRLSAAQAILAQSLSIGMLARGKRRNLLRQTALIYGLLGAVGFSWAWLNPTIQVTLLNHLVTAAAAIGGVCVLYGIGLSKIIRRENAWTRAAADTVPAMTSLALAVVLLTLISEVVYYVTDTNVPMAWPAILAMTLTLIGLAVACLIAAVVPGRDPLNLSEKLRSGYVYAAEAILGLLFLHIRLTMPWLFRGFFLQYWPLIVMGIAYLGVGLSEWFQRRRQLVLAGPLERTGTLLPLVPVIGFWISPGNVHYSFLMLIVGIMYGTLSVMRRSFLFGIVAAISTNASLWYLLHRTEGLGFLEHPQVWVIPPALCVLLAAYLNRDRLTESNMTTVRYLASASIYVSSSADIFLNGVAQAPWLPFVLGGLSLCGIFAGVAFRIRSFLFLGLSFLSLALFTIIWFAAVDLNQTWLWYVCGIVAGVLIIAVFALFEKKREEMLQVMEQLRHWQA